LSGFKNTLLNRQIAFCSLNYIVVKILECFDLMQQDCESECRKIPNNENAIRDFLFSNYLNNDAIMESIDFQDFRFSPEVPENYVDSEPQGRTDLQVFSIDEFHHRERYFIIECKRIDGNLTLNREYIKNGIRRFVSTPPQYTSYYKMNCMLGFIVRAINVERNVDKINHLLENDYPDINVRDYLHIDTISGTYISSHGENEEEQITLIHAFPNCVSLLN